MVTQADRVGQHVEADRAALQAGAIRTLVLSQVLSGLGMASGIAVGALLAQQLSGSDSLAGLGTTFQVLGGALIAIPVARVMAARGRRPGLQLGYLLAFVGAAIVRVGCRRRLVRADARRHAAVRRWHERQWPGPVRRCRPGAPGAPWSRPLDRRLGHDDRLGHRAQPRRPRQGVRPGRRAARPRRVVRVLAGRIPAGVDRDQPAAAARPAAHLARARASRSRGGCPAAS